MDSTKCSSTQDLVTFVDWVDKGPDIFIDFHEDPGKPGRLNCYDGESLEHWLNMPENTFAKWVKKPLALQIDVSGHGGEPDLAYKYVKLYTGEFLAVDGMLEKLQKGIVYPMILDADYTSIERIGNLRGRFGVSELHGQAPGHRVYKLKEKTIELRPQPVVSSRTPVEDELHNDELVLPQILDNIYQGILNRDDALVRSQIDEYINVASATGKLGLPLRIMFMYANNYEAEDIQARKKDALKYLVPYSSVSDLQIPTPEQIKNRMRLLYRIMKCDYMSRGMLKKYQSSFLKEYKAPAILLIESIVRIPADDPLDPDDDNEEYHVYFNNDEMERAFKLFTKDQSQIDKMFVAVLVRAKITMTNPWSFKSDVVTEHWGYEKDYHHYKRVMEKYYNVPDTYENMIRFYKNFDEKTIEDIINFS